MWDEAKRLRCEWYNDYEKGVTKPPIRVSDIDVVELNFRGDNVDCWMEIQQGKGPWASPVVGIVPLGTTLTMVVGIDDKQGKRSGGKFGFDPEKQHNTYLHLHVILYSLSLSLSCPQEIVCKFEEALS